MRNILFILFIAICKLSAAQTHFEAFTGYGFDVRHKQNLSMINTGLQLVFSKKSNYEFVTGVQYGFGIKRKGIDSSFTSNPSLPLYSAAEKTTHSSLISVYTNHRVKLFKFGEQQRININFICGLRFQEVKVNYKYNNSDYIVLNPSAGTNRLGLYIGTGLEYIYTMKKGRIFVQANIVSPSLRGKNPQPNSFNQSVPLSFNFGYSLKLKKKAIAQNTNK